MNINNHNRFDHTNLNEITIVYSYKDQQGYAKADVPLHTRGYIQLPAQQWDAGEYILLTFTDATNRVMDKYNLRLAGITDNEAPDVKKDLRAFIKEDVTDKQNLIEIKVNGNLVIFDKETGLISVKNRDGEYLIESGPHLNYSYLSETTQWNGLDTATYFTVESWQLHGYEIEEKL